MGFEHRPGDSYNADESVGFETDDIDLDSGMLPEARAVKAKRSPRERIEVRQGMKRDRFGRRSYDENGDEDLGEGAQLIAPDRPVRVSGAGGMGAMRTSRMMSDNSEFGYLFNDDEPVDKHMSPTHSGRLDALAYDEKQDGDGAQYESLFSDTQSMVRRKENRSPAIVAQPAPQPVQEEQPKSKKGFGKKERFSKRSKGDKKKTEAAQEQTGAAYGPQAPRAGFDEDADARARTGGQYDPRDPRGRYPYPPRYGQYPPYPPYPQYPPYPPQYPQYPPYAIPYPVYTTQNMPTMPTMQTADGQPMYPVSMIMPGMQGTFVYIPGQMQTIEATAQQPAEEKQEEAAADTVAVVVPVQPEPEPEPMALPEPEPEPEPTQTGRFNRRSRGESAPTEPSESEEAAPAQSGRFNRRSRGGESAEPRSEQQMDSAAESESEPAAPSSGRFNRRARSGDSAAATEQQAAPTGEQDSEVSPFDAVQDPPPPTGGRFNRRK